MPILQYETRVSPDGAITLPPIPEYRNRSVVVRIDGIDDWQALERSRIAGKTPEQDFLDFCEELAMPPLSDDDVDRIRYERLKEKYL